MPVRQGHTVGITWVARSRIPRRFDLSGFLKEAKALERKGALRKTEKRGAEKATRYRRARVKQLSDILTQNLSPVKRTRAVSHEFREAGYTTVGTRVYFPKATAAKVRRSKPNVYPEFIQRPERAIGGSPAALKRVHLPKHIRNLGDLKAAGQSGELDKYKAGGNYFAFTLFGNNSLMPFQDGQELVSWLDEQEEYYAPPDGDDTELWEPDEDDEDWNDNHDTDDDDEYDQENPWLGNMVLYELSQPGRWRSNNAKARYSSREERSAAAKKGWQHRRKPPPVRATEEAKKEYERTRKAAQRAAKYQERLSHGGKVRTGARVRQGPSPTSGRRR